MSLIVRPNYELAEQLVKLNLNLAEINIDYPKGISECKKL